MRSPAASVALAIACLTGASAAPALAQVAQTPSVMIKAPDGRDLGLATLSDGPHGVMVRIELKGLTPGWHGVHFHEKADCSTSDFKSAGAHVHSTATIVHGLLNPDGNDNGDLPNIFAGADGSASAELYSPLVSLTGSGGRPALLDTDGSALVVHANADDHRSQPIGGAGARIACGVIR